MKILNKIRSISRKSKLALAALTLATGFVVVPMVHAEFYPDRPTYDYNKFDPNNLNCNDANNPAAQNGRCGSLNGPVFDSFVNTPSYGDERAFFDGRLADAPANTNADAIQNVDQGSKEVVLRMYVHNNANDGTNCLPVHLDSNGKCTQIDANAPGIAHDAKVRILLPTATDQVLRARAYISADNAGQVEDTADMLSSEKFNVSYVPGSAKLLRGTAQYALSDSIVTSGAQIGNTVMNGELPGCFDYAALVEIHVKINVAPTPQLQLTKQVKVKGDANWSKQVSTKPGSDVQWLLGTKDISNANLNNVIVRDVLPPHVKLVPGSVRLINSASDKVQSDDPLFAGGFNAGNYSPGATQYVIFDTTTLDDFPDCQTQIRNIGHARSDQTPTEVTDTADVVITKDNCTPPPATPTYSCDALTSTIGDNRTATFTTAASAANGAQISLYTYDFGDNTPVLTTDKSSVTHTYAKDGQYAARVTVQVHIGDQVKTTTSDKCVSVVTFNAQPPVFTCDKFEITADADRVVKVTGFATTATNGAVFKDAVINWGDNSAATTDATPIGQTHQYPTDKDGTYNVVATAHFTVNGTDVTDTGVECAQQVSFQGQQPPTVTPPPATIFTSSSSAPTSLVNTGPGSIAAIFGIAVVAGTLVHRWFLGRRLSRQ